jgi:hypothetical protein
VMPIKLRIFFAWYDLWIGAYWSRKDVTLYVCLLPTVVFAFTFRAKKR